MKKLISLLAVTAGLCGLANSEAAARQYFVEMNGSVKAAMDKRDIDSASIIVYDGLQNEVGVYYSVSCGKCSFQLPLLSNYTLKISKKGYVPKIIDFNTDVPSGKRHNYSFQFDIYLFEEIQDIDVSILNKPIANVSFASYMNCFFYNYAYTDMVNNKVNRMYVEYYNRHRKSRQGSTGVNETVYLVMNDSNKIDRISFPQPDSMITEESQYADEDGVTASADPLVIYKIQVISVKNFIPLNSAYFANCGKVEEYCMDGTYKYTVGDFTRLEDAQIMLSGIVNIAGYEDAFIVAFRDGKRVTVGEAMKAQRLIAGGL